MSEIITFPTRMKVEMQGRSVAEFRSTLKGMRNSIVQSHTAALEAATAKLVDVGDYPESRILGPEDSVNWLQATTEDRIWGLIGTRVNSYGDGANYNMKVQCDRCPKSYTRRTDLRPIEDGGDLVIWGFEKDEHREAFKQGLPFEGKLGERGIKWRMAYGTDEELIEKLSKDNPNAETDDLNLNCRIVEVEGMHRNDVMSWIRKLGDDRIALTDLMSEASAGVDLVVDTRCPWCNSDGEATIPFDLEFWIPVVAAERDRRRRRKDAALIRMAEKN